MSESLRSALLRAIGHSVSSPQTNRAVIWINENMRREGRRGTSITRRCPCGDPGDCDDCEEES